MESSRILKSWKEISAHLRVGTRTAQRWERDFELPVHRTRDHSGSAVMALVEELDMWLQTRPARKPKAEEVATGTVPSPESRRTDYGGTLITDLLWKRPSRPPDFNRENEILRQMAPRVANQDPASVLNDLVTHAMELCKSDSAGVSLADTNDTGQAIFRWAAAAGKMQEHLGGTTPRHFSPCGVCLERNAPQLFSYPERFFTYLLDLQLPMTELLLIPLAAGPDSFGTLWVFSHEMPRKFDREDARILTNLVDFASVAVRMLRLQQQTRQADKRSAADFHAMTRLYEIGNRCARPVSSFQECLDGIVETAVAITGADKGNLQLLDHAAGVLRIAAQHGFQETFLKFFAVVDDDTCACGSAMRLANRVVIEDVTQSDVFAGQPSLDVLLAADVRAVQSMPLISSTGTVLGMISTHFRQPHRPNERELRFMDLLVRQAADYIERKQSEDALRRHNEQFKALLDNVPLGIFLMDSAFRVREANPVASRILGISDLIGRKFYEITHVLWKGDADRIGRIFRQTLDTGEPYESSEEAEEYRIERHLAKQYTWRVDRIPLPEGGYGVVCYIRTISAKVSLPMAG